ncbi:MAG: TolC family protein [Bacillota bacterium]
MKSRLVSPGGSLGHKVLFLLLLILIFCAAAAVGAETSPTADRLDLATAVRLALATDPQVAKAEAGLTQVESAVAAELAKLAPGLTVRAAHQSDFYEERVDGRATQLSFVLSSTRPGIFPLTIGAKAAGALEMAIWDRADAEAALAQTKITVAVAQKYLAALTAAENLRLAERALNLAQEDERIARANLEAGLATRLDLLKAESNTKKAALALEKARAERDLAFDALLLQLGRPFGEELALVAPTIPAALPSADLQALLAAALGARSEILQARTNLRKLEANLTRLKNSALPAVKLSATEKQGVYTATIALDLVTGDIQWSVGGSWEETVPAAPSRGSADGLSLGLELNWTPFDGGARKAQIAALEAQVASARAALAKMEKEIELELRQRVSDLALAFRSLEEAKAEGACPPDPRSGRLALSRRDCPLYRTRGGYASLGPGRIRRSPGRVRLVLGHGPAGSGLRPDAEPFLAASIPVARPLGSA